MDTDRWLRVEELFNEALELPAAERQAWLQRACGSDAELLAEVKSLLDSDGEGAGEILGAEVQSAVIGMGAQTELSVAGRRVGPYRLVRELGRGGMGAVYLASRADDQYESQVAIKLVKPGLNTEFILKRFRRERQILARLQHPNIARLLDGGTTDDNVPYLVMEYIEGAWITKHADAKRATIEERLRLFLPVLSAVQYAHRNLIVHRDIKPGNILVDNAGAPKLLDFGISKLLITETRDPTETQGIGMMTPDYASPEQVQGEAIRIASDIYSLGAVLYELLAGVKPHQIDSVTPLALHRAICTDETIAPSIAARANPSVSKRLAGDLDNIILRAMQKDPERRYGSVEAFAEDINRHLDHRPVTARPDSLLYRTGKFVRRNRVTVALGAVAMTAMIGGTIVSVRQARLAQERFDQVRQLATTIVFDVEKSIRELPGSLGARQLLAKNGIEYLDNLARSSANDWALKRQLANAYLRMGEVQGGGYLGNLGDPTGALTSLQSARTLLDEVVKNDPAQRDAQLERLTVIYRTSNIQRQSGARKEAIASVEEGLREADALVARLPEDLDVLEYSVVFHLDRGRLRQLSGDVGAAADDVATAMTHLRKMLLSRPDDREVHANMASSYARMGAIQAELGVREKALLNYRAGVTELEEQLAKNPGRENIRQQLMLAYGHVGDVLGNPYYDNIGDAAGAYESYQRMVALAEKVITADSVNVRARSDYGIALLRLAVVTPDPAQKRATLQKSVDLINGVLAKNPKDRGSLTHKAWAEAELAMAHRVVGERALARQGFEKAIATSEGVLRTDPADGLSQFWLLYASRNLAQELMQSGDRAQALALAEKSLAFAQTLEAKPALSAQANAARGWEASGSVHAQMANMESGALRDKDRDAAREAYRHADAIWTKLQSKTGFTELHRRAMEANAKELAKLEK